MQNALATTVNSNLSDAPNSATLLANHADTVKVVKNSGSEHAIQKAVLILPA